MGDLKSSHPWSIKDYLSMLKIKKRTRNVNLQDKIEKKKSMVNWKFWKFIKLKIKGRLKKIDKSLKTKTKLFLLLKKENYLTISIISFYLYIHNPLFICRMSSFVLTTPKPLHLDLPIAHAEDMIMCQSGHHSSCVNLELVVAPLFLCN